ncbi:MAG: hypothetical protein COA50_08495 [Flavobacteriaceae bacterium]|nr:MAG: hypothetical protein COA50_08495 [Flavobacteriaceae bacterium]
MKKRRVFLTRLLDSLAILVFIATFTPLVIPQNESTPFLFGIPYTIWVGFLVSVFFVVLTYLVSILTKENKNAD